MQVGRHWSPCGSLLARGQSSPCTSSESLLSYSQANGSLRLPSNRACWRLMLCRIWEFLSEAAVFIYKNEAESAVLRWSPRPCDLGPCRIKTLHVALCFSFSWRGGSSKQWVRLSVLTSSYLRWCKPKGSAPTRSEQGPNHQRWYWWCFYGAIAVQATRPRAPARGV